MMNKQEAIALMKQGAKITHRLFTREEWIRDEPLVNGTSRIKSEDGCTHTYDEFFRLRDSHRWDDGYSVWEPVKMNKLVHTRTPLPKMKWKKLSESEADDAVLSDNSLLHDLPYVGISPAASDEPMTATEVMESEKEQVNRARELYQQLESHNLRPLPATPTVFSGFGVPRYMTGADLVTEDMLILGTGMVEVDTISGEVTHISQIRPEADEWTQVEDELPEMFDLYDFAGTDIMVSSVVVTNRGAAALLDGEWVVASWDVSEACKRLEGVTRWKPIHYSGEGES